MKIKRITIKGFRSHASTEVLGLRKFNVLSGLNGSGKSTIIDAIKYVLTGTCRGTDDAGRGAEKLAAMGIGEYELTLDTSKGELTRRMGQGPRSQTHTRIAKTTGLEQDLARVLAEPTQFMQLTPTDQKALLMSLMSEPLKADEVAEMLGTLINVPGTTSRLSAAILTTLEGANDFEKQMREKRPLLKGELQGAVYVAPDAMPGIEASPEILKECKDELAELDRELIELKSAAHIGSTQRETLESKLETLNEKMAQVKAKIDGYGPRKKMAAELDRQRSLTDEVEKQDALRQEQVRLIEGEISEANATLRMTKEQAAKLQSVKGSCGACGQSVPPEYVKEAVAGLKAKHERLQKGIVEHQGLINGLKQISTDESPATLRENVATLMRTLDEYDQLTDRLEEYALEARGCEVDLKKPQAKFPAPEEIAALEAKIVNGKAYTDNVALVIRETQRREQVEAKRALTQQQLAWVEAMVEFTGPKGPLRAKLIGGGLNEILVELNAIAAPLGMAEVEIQIEPWQILVGNLPAVMLSESERYRLSLAFAGVFAKRSGAGILCLDGAEILDSVNRELLAEVLETCGLEQAIVAATGTPFESEGDWAFYHVTKQDGKSVVKLMPEGVPA